MIEHFSYGLDAVIMLLMEPMFPGPLVPPRLGRWMVEWQQEQPEAAVSV